MKWPAAHSRGLSGYVHSRLLFPRPIDDQLTAKAHCAVVDYQYLRGVHDIRSYPASDILRAYVFIAACEGRIDLLLQNYVEVVADDARSSRGDLV